MKSTKTDSRQVSAPSLKDAIEAEAKWADLLAESRSQKDWALIAGLKQHSKRLRSLEAQSHEGPRAIELLKEVEPFLRWWCDIRAGSHIKFDVEAFRAKLGAFLSEIDAQPTEEMDAR